MRILMGQSQAKAVDHLNNCLLVLNLFKYYALILSLPLFLVGSFVGLENFLAAVIHFCFGILCGLARRLLVARSRYGCWLSLFIGLVVCIAGGLVVRTFWIHGDPLVLSLLPISFMLLAIILMFNLFRREVRRLFH